MAFWRRARPDNDALPAPPAVTGVRDRSIADALHRDGFARLGPVMSPEAIAAASDVFDAAMELAGRDVGSEWFPTILFPEPEVRKLITDGLAPLVAPGLSTHVDLSSHEVMRLDFSVKPASPDSGLGPHQDYSVIDESLASNLYLWIPLSPTRVENGTLHVVPGSHWYSNKIRSRHVPAEFDDVLDEVAAAAVPIECEPGELILMSSGVIHFSPANLASETRLALHAIIKPRTAPLVFYFADEATPDDMVEAYEVDFATYVESIHRGRPDGLVPQLVPRPTTRMSAQRLKAGMAGAQERRDASDCGEMRRSVRWRTAPRVGERDGSGGTGGGFQAMTGRAVLTNPWDDARLRSDGYVVIDALDAATTQDLLETWRSELAQLVEGWRDSGFFATVEAGATRSTADDHLRSTIGARIDSLFTGHRCFHSGFLVKRPGALELDPHLDWALSDEPDHLTFNCWIPLTPVDAGRGAVSVLPGSHLEVDFDRTPQDRRLEWAQERAATARDRFVTPEVRPGQALVYDMRLLHESSPNPSADERVVVALLVGEALDAADAQRRFLAYLGAAPDEARPPEPPRSS